MKTALAAILVLFLAAALSGCHAVGPRPTVDRAPYAGPEVSIDSWAPRHQITITTPTGGWSAKLDQVRDGEGARDVFITLRRPDPEQMVTQALVPHTINSTADARIPIAVYIRVVEHGADPADFPYRLAARSS